MKVEPYLFFNGRGEEAIEFYRKVLGAEVTLLMRYSDSPEPGMCPPGADDKIMHANVRIADSTVMVSDGRCEGEPDFRGFSLSITADDLDQARSLFDTLTDGGEVEMPFQKTFWSPGFGMVTDRFGVSWMISVEE